jgi:hypothetical protein
VEDLMVLRHLAAVLPGLAVATGIGLLAGSFGADQFALRAVVFGACSFGPAYGLGWLIFLADRTGPDPVARPEETVEHQWWHRSASGSFLDLITAAGLGGAALSITGLQVDAGLVLAALVALGFADVAVRLAVLRRRDA